MSDVYLHYDVEPKFLFYSRYVRQGVLYSLAMLLSTTPPFNLVSEMEGAVGEAIQWAMGVASDDADSQCRVLARHALAIFDSIMKEVSVCKCASHLFLKALLCLFTQVADAR